VTTPQILTVDNAAVGGGVVGRLGDGRACFVEDGLVGERVSVEITEEHPRHARARVIEVLSPSPHRVEPPCPAVARGCGGCDLQHAALDEQLRMKASVIADAWERIGRLPRPDVMIRPLPAAGYRTTIRLAVDRGGVGFRAARSHDVVAVDECLVAHPLAAELITGGRYDGCDEVMIRVGARTGEAMVVAYPSAAAVSVPSGVTLVGADELASGRQAWIHELVAGRPWRISAESFFQTRPDGAEALVDEVRSAVERLVGTPSRLVDLCAGVGLFAGTVPADHVTAVEQSRSACADARSNLADLGGGDSADVVHASFAKWRPSMADVVIADPSREGLRRVGVERVALTGASVVVLVSCDAGAGARDAGLLVAAGYHPEAVTLVDLFPHTHHVEVVSVFSM